MSCSTENVGTERVRKLGLLDAAKLPVAGREVAQKVLDPYGMPSNTLMAKWKSSEGLSVD